MKVCACAVDLVAMLSKSDCINDGFIVQNIVPNIAAKVGDAVALVLGCALLDYFFGSCMGAGSHLNKGATGLPQPPNLSGKFACYCLCWKWADDCYGDR
jgi:hypothetical protein